MAKLQVGSLPSSHVENRGSGVSVTNLETGQTQIFFMPDALPPGVDQAGARLISAVGLFNGVAQDATNTLLPELIGPHVMKAVPGLLPSPYAAFVDTVGSSARDNRKTIADLTAVPAATVATAAIRQRAVQTFDAAPTDAERMRLGIETYTLPQLQGLVEIDALSILPDEMQSRIADRYLALCFAAKYGIASKYPAVATPDNPIPNGIDQKAVDAEANKFVKGVRDYEKQIANCSQIARDCIAYISIACQCSVGQAFGLLTNKA